MTRSIQAETRVFAVLGNPVRHSLSPIFQNAAILAAGIDAVYVALACEAAELPGLLRGIARARGGGNITVPHKALAAASVEKPSETVLATGACNTFWTDETGTVRGENTDVIGFVRSARQLIGGDLKESRVLLLGAGGSASAAVYGLLESGASEVVVANRTATRAEELLERHASISAGRLRTTPLESLRGETFDLAINATPLGLGDGDPYPIPDDARIRFDHALDLVYRPDRTAWVRHLRSQGLNAEDGLEMLLQQGAEAFRLWFGVDPAIDAMRAVLPQR